MSVLQLKIKSLKLMLIIYDRYKLQTVNQKRFFGGVPGLLNPWLGMICSGSDLIDSKEQSKSSLIDIIEAALLNSPQ